MISGKNRGSGADAFGSRPVAHLNARGVEITLGSGVAIRVNIKRVIRTSLHAGLTADAALVIEVDDTVGSAKKSDGGTNLNAGSVVAVVAAEHREVPPRIRVAALFNILHPCAVYSHRDVLLFLAGKLPDMTAVATVLIDNKSV